MATILKPCEPTTPSPAQFAGVAGFNLDDFAAAGVRQLKEVEVKAAGILDAARREAVAIRQRAQQEGHKEGLKGAEVETRKKIQTGVQAEIATRMPVLEAAVRRISDAEQAYLEQFRSTLITTVVAATERVVLAKLEREPEILHRWAAAAVEASKSARRLILAVHPETLVVHGEALERVLTAPGVPEDSRIEADESVPVAGVVVRVDGGSVAMTLQAAMQRLDEMLRGA